MRGWIGGNGKYYELDEPQEDTDLEVDLRPSPMYVLNEKAQWVIDQHKIRNRPIQVKAQAQAQHEIDTGVAAVSPKADDEKIVKNAVFEFVAKNWIVLFAFIGSSASMYTSFKIDQNNTETTLKIMQKRLDDMDADHKDKFKTTATTQAEILKQIDDLRWTTLTKPPSRDK